MKILSRCVFYSCKPRCHGLYESLGYRFQSWQGKGKRLKSLSQSSALSIKLRFFGSSSEIFLSSLESQALTREKRDFCFPKASFPETRSNLRPALQRWGNPTGSQKCQEDRPQVPPAEDFSSGYCRVTRRERGISTEAMGLWGPRRQFMV